MPAFDCVHLTKERDTRAFLVTDGESSEQIVAGIFTESDLVRQLPRLPGPGIRFLPIRGLMASPMITLPHSQIAEARALMALHQGR